MKQKENLETMETCLTHEDSDTKVVLKVCKLLSEDENLLSDYKNAQLWCKRGAQLAPNNTAVLNLEKKLSIRNKKTPSTLAGPSGRRRIISASDVSPCKCQKLAIVKNCGSSAQKRVMTDAQPLRQTSKFEQLLIELKNDVKNALKELDLISKDISSYGEFLQQYYYSTCHSMKNPVKSQGACLPSVSKKTSSCRIQDTQNVSMRTLPNSSISTSMPINNRQFQFGKSYVHVDQPDPHIQSIHEPYAFMVARESPNIIVKWKSRRSYRSKGLSYFKCQGKNVCSEPTEVAQQREPREISVELCKKSVNSGNRSTIPMHLKSSDTPDVKESESKEVGGKRKVVILRPSVLSGVISSLHYNEEEKRNEAQKIKLRPSQLSAVVEKLPLEFSNNNNDLLEDELVKAFEDTSFNSKYKHNIDKSVDDIVTKKFKSSNFGTIDEINLYNTSSTNSHIKQDYLSIPSKTDNKFNVDCSVVNGISFSDPMTIQNPKCCNIVDNTDDKNNNFGHDNHVELFHSSFRVADFHEQPSPTASNNYVRDGSMNPRDCAFPIQNSVCYSNIETATTNLLKNKVSFSNKTVENNAIDQSSAACAKVPRKCDNENEGKVLNSSIDGYAKKNTRIYEDDDPIQYSNHSFADANIDEHYLDVLKETEQSIGRDIGTTDLANNFHPVKNSFEDPDLDNDHKIELSEVKDTDFILSKPVVGFVELHKPQETDFNTQKDQMVKVEYLTDKDHCDMQYNCKELCKFNENITCKLSSTMIEIEILQPARAKDSNCFQLTDHMPACQTDCGFNSKCDGTDTESCAPHSQAVSNVGRDFRAGIEYMEPIDSDDQVAVAANDSASLIATDIGRLLHSNPGLLSVSLDYHNSSTLSDSGYTSPICFELNYLSGDFDRVARNMVGQFTLHSNFSHKRGIKLPLVHPFCNCVLAHYLLAVLRDRTVSSLPFGKVLDLNMFLGRLRDVFNSIGSHRGKQLFVLSICKADDAHI